MFSYNFFLVCSLNQDSSISSRFPLESWLMDERGEEDIGRKSRGKQFSIRKRRGTSTAAKKKYEEETNKKGQQHTWSCFLQSGLYRHGKKLHWPWLFDPDRWVSISGSFPTMEPASFFFSFSLSIYRLYVLSLPFLSPETFWAKPSTYSSSPLTNPALQPKALR